MQTIPYLGVSKEVALAPPPPGGGGIQSCLMYILPSVLSVCEIWLFNPGYDHVSKQYHVWYQHTLSCRTMAISSALPCCVKGQLTFIVATVHSHFCVPCPEKCNFANTLVYMHMRMQILILVQRMRIILLYIIKPRCHISKQLNSSLLDISKLATMVHMYCNCITV